MSNLPSLFMLCNIDKCPPCFNCLLPAFTCGQFGHCDEFDGQCKCPPGWGGIDCLLPRTSLAQRLLDFHNPHPLLECGSLADGVERPLRGDDPCECKDGWGGINCNGNESNVLHHDIRLSERLPVCKSDNACIGFPLAGGIHTEMDDENVANMTCYKGGETVFNNHQMCDITSTFLKWSGRLQPNFCRPEDFGHATRPSTTGHI